jgi:hypothetical protein
MTIDRALDRFTLRVRERVVLTGDLFFQDQGLTEATGKSLFSSRIPNIFFICFDLATISLCTVLGWLLFLDFCQS